MNQWSYGCISARAARRRRGTRTRTAPVRWHGYVTCMVVFTVACGDVAVDPPLDVIPSFDAAHPDADCDPVHEPDCEEREPTTAEDEAIRASMEYMMCYDAKERLQGFLDKENGIRIRIDSNFEAHADWHWGEYVHIRPDVFTITQSYPRYLAWVLAHEMGRDWCERDNQSAADAYADSCVGDKWSEPPET